MVIEIVSYYNIDIENRGDVMLSIGIVYCGNYDHLDRIIDMMEDTKEVGFEFLFACQFPVDSLITQRFSEHLNRVTFVEQGEKSKDQLYNEMIYSAKHPYMMFYNHHIQLERKSMILMIDQIDRLKADVVFSSINDDLLSWYKRRKTVYPFVGVKTVFQDSSLMIQLTDSLFGKMFRIDFLKEHRIRFTDVLALYHIPFMITVAIKKAKFTYCSDSITYVEQDHAEDYDIFESLDKVAQISKRFHVDDLFDAEFNYIYLREIAIEWMQSYKDAPRNMHKELLFKAKSFVQRRNVRFESKYLSSDPAWVRLYLSYSKMILK